MEHDDELQLAPISDDELGLAPVKDDEAEKLVAPEVPFNVGSRLIPVVCSACKTRMYAGEDQVGLWKRCPDCYRLTEILAVPPRFMLIADDPEAAGGYGVQQPAISKQEISQLKTENQKTIDEYRKKQDQIRNENRLPPQIIIDKPLVMEGALDRLLKTQEEKNEESEIIRRQTKIERETEAVKQAVRNGKLNEYLDPSQDPAERKRREKQREFAAAATAKTEKLSSAVLPQSEPEVPLYDTSDSFDDRYPSGSLIAPLLDSRCRARMIVLAVCGLLGNFTGEKARSMIWQILVDQVYGQVPGYMYNVAESGIFLVNFWFGAVLSIVWLTMLFLFGISLFLASAEGRDRVDHWTPFSLDFGLSYFGWTLLILFVSGSPGITIWQSIGFILPDMKSQLIWIHFLGLFLCFPILFLCVIESDMFYGSAPRKTLASLHNQPGLWFLFYATAAILVAIPSAILFALFFAATAWNENWMMHSFVYYLIAAILLTFCGYFVLLYFRLLGNMAQEISYRSQVRVQDE